MLCRGAVASFGALASNDSDCCILEGIMATNLDSFSTIYSAMQPCRCFELNSLAEWELVFQTGVCTCELLT